MTKETTLQAILNQIKHKRERMNYTQAALAAQIGYGQNAYSKMELGLSEMKLGVYLDICRLLGLDAAEVLWTALKG